MSSTAPKLAGLGKVQIGGETAFGTEAAAADLVDMRVISVDRSGLTHEAIPNEFQRQDFYEVEPILGRKNGTITTEHYLHGFNSSVPSAASTHLTPENDAATGFDMLFGIIASAFGDQITQGYVDSDSLSWGSPDITLTTATSFDSGQLVTWKIGTNPETYASGWVTNNTATVLTMVHTTNANDPQGDTLWGSYTAGAKAGDTYRNAFGTSFSIKIFGHDADDVTTCLGCAVTGLQMSFEMGMPPKMTVTWGVADWDEDTSGGAPAVITWAFPAPEAIKGAQVVYGLDTSSTQFISNLTFDLGLDVRPVLDYNAIETIGQWQTVDIKPRITYSVLRDVSAEPTTFAALTTTNPFVATFGDTPGRIISLIFPSAIIAEFPSFEDGDGSIMSPVTLLAGYNTDSGSSSVTDTICRVAFG